MRFVRLALLSLTLLMAYGLLSAENPYLVKEFRMNVHGAEWDFDVLDVMDYTTDLGCRLDTGAVDIVWALDTTGSMGGTIASVRATIGSFISELDARGYDYRLGATTYGDRPVRIWDFDLGTPGFQMTSNAAAFITKLNSTGASGGGDGPENSIDAIAHAITDYDWRPDALHVIITFTDNSYHYRGDGSGFSDYTHDEVYSLVMSTGTVVFFAHSAWSASATAYYDSLATDSGGASYPLSTSWSVILDDVIALLSTWEAINANITNNTGTTCALNALLIPNNLACLSILSSNPIIAPVASPGGNWNISWRVENSDDPSCGASDRCFYIRLWGCGGEEDTLYGCTTDDSCRCVGPDAEVTYPLILPSGDCGVMSACEYQEVQWRIWNADPLAAPIDPTTIQITVDGVTYNYPDHMTYIGDILTFTPTVPWEHGDMVEFYLDQVLTIEGCPMFGRPGCWFMVDLHPPELLEPISPECGILLEDTNFVAQWNIADDIAGIDIMNSYFTVNGVPFYPGTEHVDFTGSTSAGLFTIEGTFGELGFYAAESVVVCLEVADQVESDFCGPNDTTYCCTWYLNNPPYAYFVYPGLDSITACNPDSILLVIADPDGPIDPSSVILSVDGLWVDVSMDVLSYVDSFLVFTPPYADYWSDGDTVRCELIAATDPWGASVPDLPIYWEFIVDYRPPMITSFAPPYGIEFYTMPDSAYIDLFDFVSGVDTTGMILTINGIEYGFTGGWTTAAGFDSVFRVDIPLSMEVCMGAGETCNVEICLDNIHDRPDYCEPNDTSFCTMFTIIRSGPIPEIVFAPHAEYIACHDSTITIRIDTTLAAVDSNSIRLTINGETRTIDNDSLSLIDGIWLVWNPGFDWWLDDTVYEVSLDSLADIWGTPAPAAAMPLDWLFYTDFSPPTFDGEFPPAGVTVATESPTIYAYIEDDITGVDPLSPAFEVSWGDTSVIFSRSHACVDYDPATGRLELRTDCADLVFEDHDTVTVCISAHDQPHHCDPNVGEFCWDFVVSLSPPDPGIVTYLPSTWVACDSLNQAVMMTIVDPDGIDTSTIVIMIEDSLYSWGDPELSWDGDSVLTFTPLDPWSYFTNAQTVDVCIMEVSDLLGNALEDPLCWSFEMDLSAPWIWGPEPRPDTLLNDSLAVITIHMWDSLTGVDSSTIYITVNGETMGVDDSCVTWEWGDSILTFDIGCIPDAWEDWDTVNITVGACDSPDTCAPNCSEYSWRFFVHLTGPVADIITPLPGQITSCADQCIEMVLYDDWEGVDDTTIVLVINETDTFTTASPMLTYSEEDSLLMFCPDEDAWRYWDNEEEVRVELIAAYDSLGNPLGTPLDWSFEVDLEAPQFTGITPVHHDTLSMLYPVIEFNVTDNLAGVDADSVYLVVAGVRYYITDPSVTWDGTHFTWNSPVMFTGGDSIVACIHAQDTPDLCPPNENDSCWVFYIESGGPVPAAIRPTIGRRISSCYDEYVEFSITDENGIIDTSVHFYVVRSSDLSDTAYMDYDSPEVTYTYTPLPLHRAIVRYTPPVAFFDPETVTVCVTHALDSVYNPMAPSPYCWEFYMDQNPPDVWRMMPPDGDVVAERSPEISFRIWDYIAGLDSASVAISIIGTGLTFGLDTACVTVTPAESLVTIDTDCLGLEWTGGDVVEVSVIATDSTDYCADNFTNPRWSFTIEPGGPEAEIARPMPGDTSSCWLEYIQIHLWDPTGVDTTTIVMLVNGERIEWGDPRMSYDPVTEMLYFVPDPVFGDIEVVEVELIEAFDWLGNPLETPLDWDFMMDRLPPVISGLFPLDSTANPSPNIEFYLSDITSGVNYDSLIVTVTSADGSFEYRLSSPSLSALGDSLIRYNPDIEGRFWFGGDTVCVDIIAFDLADDYYGIGDYDGEECPPNSSDTSWCFVITPGGPVGEFVYPHEGAWVACDPDSVIMTLTDPDTVVDSSIVVWVERVDVGLDETYTTDDPEISYDGINYLYYYPDPPFEDGETVRIAITEAYDELFNELESCDTMTFMIDYTPPVMLGHTPECEEVLDDIRPNIDIELFDSLSGIDPSSIELIVNGSVYTTSMAGLEWDGNVLSFSPLDADIRFYGGDTVCFDVHVEDSPDYCAPHALDYGCCFYIAPGGPIPNWVRPEPGAWSACPGEDVTATIEDPQGILDTTIVVRVTRYAGTASETTTDFITYDAALSFDYPNLTFTPSPLFEDAESVYFCIVAAEDSLSNPLAAELCWGFNMDLSSPVYWNEQPPSGTELTVRSNPIAVNLHDSLTGINPESIELHFRNVSSGETFDYRYDDPGINYDPALSIIEMSVEDLGIIWTGGDSICIDVEAFDSPSDTSTGFNLDYCRPNWSNFEWCFTVAPGGPTAELIYFANESHVSCVDDAIDMYLRDADVGVDPETIVLEVNGQTISWPDDRLAYDPDAEILTYDPEPDFQDGVTYVVNLRRAEDYLGNVSTNLIVDWTFTIDRTPPVYSVVEPVLPEAPDFYMTRDKEQPLIIEIHDAVSGLNENSVLLTLNGVQYDNTQFDWEYDVDTQIGRLEFDPRAHGIAFLEGDTVNFSIQAQDTIDFCDDNDSQESYWFLIEPDVQCAQYPNPFSPNLDGYNDISVFDWPYMFTEGAKIQIFDKRKQLVFEKEIDAVDQLADYDVRSWDGRDKNGEKMNQGVYIYIITKDGEVVCEGTFVLIR